MPSQKLPGLMLTDLVVVLVIVSVLAAAAVPQLVGPPKDSRAALAEYNLATLRSAVEVYRTHNQSRNPPYDGRARSISSLTRRPACADSATSNRQANAYLEAFPKNSFTGIADVVTTDRTGLTVEDISPGGKGGWQYNPTTGQVFLDSNPGFDL